MLDPVTLAVLNGRLEQIADEMDATLYRSAFNPIIAEARRLPRPVRRRQRRHAGAGQVRPAGVRGRHVIRGPGRRPRRPGAAACGWRRLDPERPYDGGTHANDFKLVRPVFRGGELYCYLASAAHWHDVGGAVPGNYNPAATECWQEAVQIPPVRMVRGGELDEDVLAILKANSRLPDSLWGDLNGQLAALELGAGRSTICCRSTATTPCGPRWTRAPARPAPDAGPRGQPAGRRVPLSRHAGQRRRQDAELTIALRLRASGERLELDFRRPRRPAPARSISRAPPPWPPATWRSSTCSRTCRPMPACWTR